MSQSVPLCLCGPLRGPHRENRRTVSPVSPPCAVLNCTRYVTLSWEEKNRASRICQCVETSPDQPYLNVRLLLCDNVVWPITTAVCDGSQGCLPRPAIQVRHKKMVTCSENDFISQSFTPFCDFIRLLHCIYLTAIDTLQIRISHRPTDKTKVHKNMLHCFTPKHPRVYE